MLFAQLSSSCLAESSTMPVCAFLLLLKLLLLFLFYTGSIERQLTLRKCVSDLCVCMFCLIFL